MGWLWTSSSADAPTTTTTSTTTTTTSPSATIGTTTTQTSLVSDPSSAQPTPSKSHDDAFAAAFPHLAPSSSSSTTSPNTIANPQPLPTDTDTLPDPTIPTHLSCRTLFDSAFYCSSFGGHFNDVYRYGHLRSCSEHWADWRFCMALKSRSEEAKRDLIRERWEEKERERKRRGCSEDVWRVRRRGEEVERPFARAHEMDD